MMKIKDKPDFATKPKPISFAGTETVRTALNAMCEQNIGSIVIVDSAGNISGIVTERDMLTRVLYRNADLDQTQLTEIMSTEVRVAKEDDDALDWIHIMFNERFRHLPIVNDEGKLVNLMSQGDFVAYTWPDLYERVKQDLKGQFAKLLRLAVIALSIATLGFILFLR